MESKDEQAPGEGCRERGADSSRGLHAPCGPVTLWAVCRKRHVWESPGAGHKDNEEGPHPPPASCSDLPRGRMKGKGTRTQATSPAAKLLLPKEQHSPPNTPGSPCPPPSARKSLHRQEQPVHKHVCLMQGWGAQDLPLARKHEVHLLSASLAFPFLPSSCLFNIAFDILIL